MVNVKSKVYIFTSCGGQLARLEIGTLEFAVCSVTGAIRGISATGGGQCTPVLI